MSGDRLNLGPGFCQAAKEENHFTRSDAYQAAPASTVHFANCPRWVRIASPQLSILADVLFQIMEADIQQPPTEPRAVLVEGGSWEDRRVAVRVVQQEKYTESYVLRGPRPEGGIYSSGADEGSCYLPQGTYGQDTLRPVTIKQVLDAQQPHPDADFKIDDVEITQVNSLVIR